VTRTAKPESGSREIDDSAIEFPDEEDDFVLHDPDDDGDEEDGDDDDDDFDFYDASEGHLRRADQSTSTHVHKMTKKMKSSMMQSMYG
jgi:hypothetical protein